MTTRTREAWRIILGMGAGAVIAQLMIRWFLQDSLVPPVSSCLLTLGSFAIGYALGDLLTRR